MSIKRVLHPGDKFNRWTFVRETGERNSRRQTLCEWECECGNRKILPKTLVTSGASKSCGCWKSEVTAARNRANTKPCKYRKYKKYIRGFFNTSKESFIIDCDDYDVVSPYAWQLTKKGYARTNLKKEDGGGSMLMHRLIFNHHNPGVDYDILDHINGNKLDNRVENLRIVNAFQNMQNKGASIKNKSGYVGVNYSKNSKKWVARITVDGKRISLGYYKDIKDAAKTRKDAEIKYFGEYRRK